MLPWWRGRIVLGRTGFLPWQRVWLNAAERATHLYVVGKTTMGKSKLLEHLLYQDIAHGRGAAVVDPHGDLAEDLVRYLVTKGFTRAEKNLERLVYFDPAREDYCLALNPLEVEAGTDPYEAAQEVVEVFRRIWPIQGGMRFGEVLDQGKALIVNLGGVSEPTARLLGSLVVLRLYQAALARGAESPREARRPFYLYIDEFQQFVAQEGGVRTFSQLVSSCAKFGLHLVLAHQSQSQLEARMKGALGNVGTMVAFALDREDAEALAKKLFDVDVQEIKDEPHTEVQHPLYYALQEQWERHAQALQALPPRWAYVRKPLASPVLMATFAVKDRGAREEEVETVKVVSLRRYGRPLAEVKREIERRYAQAAPALSAYATPSTTSRWTRRHGYRTGTHRKV